MPGESYAREGARGSDAVGLGGGLAGALRAREGGVHRGVLLGLGGAPWVFTITRTRPMKKAAMTTGGTSAET